MFSIQSVAKTVAHEVLKNSPTLLTALGVAGVVTTTVMAVQATPGALKAIKDAEDAAYSDDTSFYDFTSWGKTQIAWKYYIPTAIMGVTTIVCIVGSNSINLRRNAAIASAYAFTETALKEYKEKVVETLGETKERKIHDAIVQDHLDANPLSTKQIVFLGKGDQLCYDSYSGRYFKSDSETIRRAENQINATLIDSMYASLNDFWNAIGLEETTIGEDIGWCVENMLHLDFTSKLTDDGQPCLVIEYLVKPKYDFYNGINA